SRLTWPARLLKGIPNWRKRLSIAGHEASGHGQTWEPQYSMTPEQERAGYQTSIDTIQRVTGTRPVGFNAFWLRGTPNTLGILQDLGFIYHIDDISQDEPFTVTVKGKPFAVVPSPSGLCQRRPTYLTRAKDGLNSGAAKGLFYEESKESG